MDAQQIQQAVNNPHNATFATITYATPVKTAAKHMATVIEKRTRASVILFASGYAYEQAVRRSASKLGQVVDSFEKSDTYFTHDPLCYSIVEHKTYGTKYLFAVFNKVYSSEYTVNGAPASKLQVAEYLTPSAVKKLLEPTDEVHNVKNDVTHTVQVRTIKLDNIETLKVNGQELV